MPPDLIERASKRALDSGWQVAVHAIGDRANRVVLDAFEHAGCATHPDHRFRLEHAQILAASDLARLRPLGVIASMQPTHATSDMPWAEARLGRERLAGAYAWRSVLDSGARLAFGSDFPVEDPSVLAGLFAAVTRTDAAGHPAGGWLPQQRVSLDEAIRGYTSDAAFAAFEESWRGRAAVGQAADLTVFDRELKDATSLLKAKVTMTIVGGNVAFSRP
jgi:predicted amidohydrolase YtcJ